MIPKNWALRAQIYTASAETVGDEPLIVDLRVPGFNDPNRHGIILRVDGLVTIPPGGRSPDIRGVPPNSGLYLCPESTVSENEVEATAGIVAQARPLALPLNDPYLDVAQVGLGFSIALVGIDTPYVVPKNWFLRLIINARQGEATPGPGVGSVGRLRALVVIDDDFDKADC